MRPLSIKFQCFGPYLEMQEIDFTQLGEQSLFLICGETGSGKTTILEAMCYALYGRSSGDPGGEDQEEKRKQSPGKKSGGFRGELWTMRNENAPEDMDTIVEYTFAVGEAQYRFRRCLKPIKSRSGGKEKKNGEKYNEICQCWHLVEGEQVLFPDGKETKTYVNKKAREIIGLNHAQFCQVIVLPQGKFETLLTSTSAEKEGILVQLFRAQKWQKATDLLDEQVKEREKTLRERKEDILRRLSAYGCKEPEELEQKRNTQREEAKKAKEKEEAAKILLEKKNREVEEAIKLEKRFADRDNAEKVLQKLKDSEKIYEKDRQALSLGARAEALGEDFSAYEKKREEITAARKALKEAEEKKAEEESHRRSVKEKRRLHDLKKEKIEETETLLKLYESKRTVYTSLEAKKQKEEDREAAYGKAKEEAEAGEKTLASANRALLLAQSRYHALSEENRALWKRYMGGISYELAKKLQEGEKCPVCGSIHHPEPAEPWEDQVTREQLDCHDKTLKEAFDQVEACKALQKDGERENGKRQNALIRAKTEWDGAVADYRETKKECVEGIPHTLALERAIGNKEREIQAFAREETELNKQEGRIEEALRIAEETLKRAVHTGKHLELQWEKARNAWEKKRREAGFREDREYESASMDPKERERRQKKVNDFDRDLEIAQQEYREKCEDLRSLEKPQVKKLQGDRDFLQESYGRMVSAANACRTLVDTIEKDLGDIQEANEIYEEDREKTERLRTFVDGLIGSRGISLQRYVLGVMMDAITQEANQILRRVYDGRYHLYRMDDSGGRAHKRGLELGVYSNGGGEGRAVSSLSGGEKFLVSLCLAIGLSVVVQSQGRGNRMEALFVDEGFGSLDQNRIRDALTILNDIKGSSGLVGVISHVEALAESISAKLRIRKTEKGSKCELHI